MSDTDNSKIIVKQAEWDYYLGKIDKSLLDIFHFWEYNNLYVTENTTIEAFVYNADEKIFFFPYLKNKIPGCKYYDFETAYGYSGPIYNSDDSEFINFALNKFHDYCINSDIIAGFIRFNPILENHKLLLKTYINIEKNCNVVYLDLKNKSEEELFSDYSKNNRNKIRFALKNNLKIEKKNDKESLELFNSMYVESMEKHNADSFYLFGKKYFDDIENNLKNSYHVLLAYKEEILSGGALILYHDKKLTYFLSAVNDVGRKLGTANLLRHSAVQFAKDKNIQYINFGGGVSADENDSLFIFKKGFSKETKEFYIGKCIVNREIYDKLCSDWVKKSDSVTINKYNNRLLKYRY